MSAPAPVNSSQTARQNAAKQGAAALAQQQAQQAAQRALAAANDRAILNGAQRGAANGRVTFDSKGNILVDGKLATDSTGNPLFSSQNAQNRYLAERGLANNGELINADLAAKSDFSTAPGLEPRGNPDYENARIKARNESPELVFTEGQIKQNNPNRLNPTISFGENKPAETTNISFTPKGTQSSITSDSVFSAKQPTSKINNSEAENVFGSGRNISGIKNPPITGSFGQRDKGELIRNTVFEDEKKQSEADRASQIFGYSTYENADYFTGGTPPPRSQGGISTPQSVFLESKTNYGQRGNNQNIRNSEAESLLLVSEANRALAKEQTENVSFTTFTTPKPKTGPKNPDLFNDEQIEIGLNNLSIAQQNSRALGQGLTNLSNNQKYTVEEKAFNDYLTTNANKGATIQIIEGERVLGTFQGPKAISGVQAFEKAHPDESFSISAYFPEREKALTEAVQSNPSPFLNQPKGFWDQAAKNGYLSQNNAQKIQNTLYLESAIENRESLAGFRGTSSQYLYETTDNGQAVSVGRFPFSGGKTYNSIVSSLGLPNRAQNKTSSQEVPSTSLANFLIFTPTFGNSGIKLGSEILEDLVGQGAKAVAKAPKFKLTDLGESANSVQNPTIRKVLSPFLNTPKLEDLPKSGEIQVRNRETFRNTNPTRSKLPSDIFSNDNANGENPLSNIPKIPPTKQTKNSFEDVTKETQTKLTKIQNDLLNPTPKVNNPPASTNLPFFAGRVNAQGKQLTGNKAPITLTNPTSNEAVSVSGKTASIAPISTFTLENTGLSPISRESFAPQFTGTYPQNYLPIATRESFPSVNYPVQEDPFYTPASRAYNIDIGNGELPSGSFSASNDLIGFKKNRLTENQSIFLRNTQFGLTKPVSKSNAIRIFESKAPEEINPLGRRGKSPIQRNTSQSNPIDFLQTPRSEFVESGAIKPNQEVFTSRGKKLRNESGDVFFSDLGRPQGALSRIEPKSIVSKREVNLPERNDYQDWRFSNYLKNSPLKFGIKLGEAKEVNLEPRGDYQDWRFNEFIKKNPEKGPQESIGSKSFDLDLKKLPKQYSKAATFSSTNKEIKGLTFKSTSANLVEKPKETKKDDFGFKSNTGSGKSETLLLTKKPLKKGVLTSTTLSSDYDFELVKTPPTRESSILISNQKEGLLGGLKFASILSPKQASKSRLDVFSKNGLGLKDFNIFSGKLGQDLFPKQNTRQTPRQVPDIFQTPRQSQRPKQGQKQKMNPPQVPRTNQTTSSSFKFFTPEVPIFAPPPPPPRVPLFKPNFSNWNVKGNGKGKSGPTAIENLSVFNVFSSSFNIEVPKGKRFEF